MSDNYTGLAFRTDVPEHQITFDIPPSPTSRDFRDLASAQLAQAAEAYDVRLLRDQFGSVLHESVSNGPSWTGYYICASSDKPEKEARIALHCFKEAALLMVHCWHDMARKVRRYRCEI